MCRPIVAASMLLACVALPLVATGQGVSGPSEFAVRVNDDFEVLTGIEYRTDEEWVPTLDVYRPRKSSVPTPAVVFFHAEGLRKEQQLFATLPFMEMGFAVINVEYRPAIAAVQKLASPDRLGAVEDAVCALRWVGAHAREHRLDLSRLVVSGRSSGGHKALIASLSSAFGPVLGCAYADTPKVAAILNWYGPGGEARETDSPSVRHSVSIDRMVGIEAPPLLGIFMKTALHMRHAETLMRLWQNAQRPADILFTAPPGSPPEDTAENMRVWRAVEDFLRTHEVLSPVSRRW